MVSPTVTSLAIDLAALTARVAALETKMAGHEGRIKVLEGEMAAHQAGALERQAEVDRLQSENERIRWAARNGRQDIL